MSNFFETLLWPIRWLIEAVLVSWHSLLTLIGLPADAGFTWLLSILLLLIVVRLAVLPLMIRAVRSSQQMSVLAPELDRIRQKYQGKNDQTAQAALMAETMALYKESNVNPLGSFLPLVIQIPLFFGLYYVLRIAQEDKGGVGLLTQGLATSFGNSSIFGAPLHDSLFNAHGNPAVIIVSLVLIALVGVSQFVAQLLTLRFNMTEQALLRPLNRLQVIPLYLIPVVLIVTSIAIPLGLLSYLAFSSLWTFGQQVLFIRHLPMPTSRAAKSKAARDARRGRTVPGQGASE